MPRTRRILFPRGDKSAPNKIFTGNSKAVVVEEGQLDSLACIIVSPDIRQNNSIHRKNNREGFRCNIKDKENLATKNEKKVTSRIRKEVDVKKDRKIIGRRKKCMMSCNDIGSLGNIPVLGNVSINTQHILEGTQKTNRVSFREKKQESAEAHYSNKTMHKSTFEKKLSQYVSDQKQTSFCQNTNRTQRNNPDFILSIFAKESKTSQSSDSLDIEMKPRQTMREKKRRRKGSDRTITMCTLQMCEKDQSGTMSNVVTPTSFSENTVGSDERDAASSLCTSRRKDNDVSISSVSSNSLIQLNGNNESASGYEERQKSTEKNSSKIISSPMRKSDAAKFQGNNEGRETSNNQPTVERSNDKIIHSDLPLQPFAIERTDNRRKTILSTQQKDRPRRRIMAELIDSLTCLQLPSIVTTLSKRSKSKNPPKREVTETTKPLTSIPQDLMDTSQTQKIESPPLSQSITVTSKCQHFLAIGQSTTSHSREKHAGSDSILQKLDRDIDQNTSQESGVKSRNKKEISEDGMVLLNIGAIGSKEVKLSSRLQKTIKMLVPTISLQGKKDIVQQEFAKDSDNFKNQEEEDKLLKCISDDITAVAPSLTLSQRLREWFDTNETNEEPLFSIDNDTSDFSITQQLFPLHETNQSFVRPSSCKEKEIRFELVAEKVYDVTDQKERQFKDRSDESIPTTPSLSCFQTSCGSIGKRGTEEKWFDTKEKEEQQISATSITPNLRIQPRRSSRTPQNITRFVPTFRCHNRTKKCHERVVNESGDLSVRNESQRKCRSSKKSYESVDAKKKGGKRLFSVNAESNDFIALRRSSRTPQKTKRFVPTFKCQKGKRKFPGPVVGESDNMTDQKETHPKCRLDKYTLPTHDPNIFDLTQESDEDGESDNMTDQKESHPKCRLDKYTLPTPDPNIFDLTQESDEECVDANEEGRRLLFSVSGKTDDVIRPRRSSRTPQNTRRFIPSFSHHQGKIKRPEQIIKELDDVTNRKELQTQCRSNELMMPKSYPMLFQTLCEKIDLRGTPEPVERKLDDKESEKNASIHANVITIPRRSSRTPQNIKRFIPTFKHHKGKRKKIEQEDEKVDASDDRETLQLNNSFDTSTQRTPKVTNTTHAFDAIRRQSSRIPQNIERFIPTFRHHKGKRKRNEEMSPLVDRRLSCYTESLDRLVAKTNRKRGNGLVRSSAFMFVESSSIGMRQKLVGDVKGNEDTTKSLQKKSSCTAHLPTRDTTSKSVKRNSRHSSDRALWDKDMIKTLKRSHNEADPTSASFWQQISTKVPGKSMEQCQDKWFSLVEAPILPSKKRSKTQKNEIQDTGSIIDDEEDDIFNSTPLKGAFKYGKIFDSIEGTLLKHSLATDGLTSPLHSIVIRKKALLSSPDRASSPLKLRAKYKTYINRMRAVGREAMKQKKHNISGNVTKVHDKQSVSATAYAGDVHMDGILSPGGTIKIRAPEEIIDEYCDMSESEDEFSDDGI